MGLPNLVFSHLISNIKDVIRAVLISKNILSYIPEEHNFSSAHILAVLHICDWSFLSIVCGMSVFTGIIKGYHDNYDFTLGKGEPGV